MSVWKTSLVSNTIRREGDRLGSEWGWGSSRLDSARLDSASEVMAVMVVVMVAAVAHDM